MPSSKMLGRVYVRVVHFKKQFKKRLFQEDFIGEKYENWVWIRDSLAPRTLNFCLLSGDENTSSKPKTSTITYNYGLRKVVR